jgi:anti-sigma-K factor RskA
MSGPDDMMADDALALDYALGALGRAERRAVETRMRNEPAFRVAVEGWQQQLAGLDEDVAPVAPPAAVWEAIAADIAPAVVKAAAPAPAPARPGFWQNLAIWRGLAIGGPVLAALAVVMVAQPEAGPDAIAPPAATKGTRLIATLAGSDGKPLINAAYDPSRGAVDFAPVAAQDAGDNKVPELWVIEGKNPPRSLGVIDIAGGSHAIPADRIAGLKPGSILAISIEPRGGSTTGAPTGPVVAMGKLTAA